MAYTPQTWADAPSTSTPISAARLTVMENGIAAAETATNKGAASGYAPLDGSALVPSVNLPSYVDDVLEYANLAAFPATGVSGKIYVALDSNKTYRWSGSAYVEVSPGPGSTDSVTEGSSNLYYTNARADARIAAARGVTVQAYDADLDALAAMTAPATKLAGIATNATANDTDANLKARANHTGTQAASTISDFSTAADARIAAARGVTVQAWDTDLDTWATKTPPTGAVAGTTDTQAFSGKTISDKLDITTVATPATPSTGLCRLFSGTAKGLDALGYLTSVGVPIVLGRDVIFLAKNVSGATLTKGTVVYISGANAGIPQIDKAQSTAALTKLPAAGLVLADIANNATGAVMMKGVLLNVNTGGMGDGSPLYVSTTAGAFTNVRPTHPNPTQAIGYVEDANLTTGDILVNCGPTLAALHDGTNNASWAVGDGTGVGAKSVLFKNSNTGTLQWTPTGARTITLPDATGTAYVSGSTDVAIADGGTGVSTLPTGLLKGAGTGAITAATVGTDYGTPDASTKTLTNTRVTKRVATVASSATPTFATDTNDQSEMLTLAANITSATFSGTPTPAQTHTLVFKSASAQTIALGSSVVAGPAPLLAATVAGKYHEMVLKWNSTAAKWVVMASDAVGYT